MLFPPKTVSQMAISFANYHPGGKLFIAKNEPLKNLQKYIQGISEEAVLANNLLNAFNEQFYPDQTIDFLQEWEKALGIPDECLEIAGLTIQERRRDILVKLAGMAAQTAEDFEDVATAFGVASTVVGGLDPLVSPVIVPDKTARFTIVVIFIPPTVFPYTFPLTFGSDEITVLQCLFARMAPANCQVLFQSA